jgi:hypothetical protein
MLNSNKIKELLIRIEELEKKAYFNDGKIRVYEQSTFFIPFYNARYSEISINDAINLILNHLDLELTYVAGKTETVTVEKIKRLDMVVNISPLKPKKGVKK